MARALCDMRRQLARRFFRGRVFPVRFQRPIPWEKLLRPARRSVMPQGPHQGPVFFADWLWVVVTGWLQVGNTGFQQSFADVLHIRLLGKVQGGDK